MGLSLTYIRWKDACYRDAAEHPEAQAELAELCEVGILLHENEEAVLIGMEFSADTSMAPGRWRLNIPKVNIIERKDVPFDTVFGVKKAKKPRKKKEILAVEIKSC